MHGLLGNALPATHALGGVGDRDAVTLARRRIRVQQCDDEEDGDHAASSGKIIRCEPS